MSSRWKDTRPPRVAVCIGCKRQFYTMSTRPGFEACSIGCRFVGGVDARGPGECWPWMHVVDKGGYGEFRFEGQKYRPHRIALEIKIGRAIQPGLEAMHSCDNPPCCNGAHLSEGTVKQNAADRVAKGRSNAARGIDAGNARLNDAEVLEIRSSKDGAAALAERFGVGEQCIYKIRRGERWRHLP